jgi:hypothetical protein
MSEAQDAQAQEQEEAVPEMVVDYEAECESLTGRSVLTFQIGHEPEGDEPQLRILRNSGKGMFCRDWAPVARIDAILTKADVVSVRILNDVHPGKSINTGGFILAILRELGVVQPKEESRCHERVPGASLRQAITFKLKEAAALDKHRKAKAG